MTETATFERAILRRRTTSLASRRVDRDIVKMENALIFRLGQERYALSVDFLDGVFPSGRITPVPGAAPPMLGFCMVRGVIRPALDLAVCVGLDALTQYENMLLMKNKALPIVLAVSSVEEVAAIRTDNLAKCPEAGGNKSFINGMTHDGILVLNGPIVRDQIFCKEERQ